MLGFLFRTMKLALKISIGLAGIAVLISYARLSEFGDMRAELLDTLNNSYPGRLQIEGPVSLDLAFPPRVTIEGVRIKNAEWGTRPDMLTAERVVAELDLLPLVQGEMALPRLRMFGVDIVVEQRGEATNWDELNNFETAAGPGSPTNLPVMLPQISNAAVTVAGATIDVLGAAGSPVTTLALGPAEIAFSAGGFIPCP